MTAGWVGNWSFDSWREGVHNQRHVGGPFGSLLAFCCSCSISFGWDKCSESPSLPFHYINSRWILGNVSFEDPLLDHSPILGGHLDSNVATSCFILRGEDIKGEKDQRKGWKMMEVWDGNCSSNSLWSLWFNVNVLIHIDPRYLSAHLTWTTYFFDPQDVLKRSFVWHCICYFKTIICPTKPRPGDLFPRSATSGYGFHSACIDGRAWTEWTRTDPYFWEVDCKPLGIAQCLVPAILTERYLANRTTLGRLVRHGDVRFHGRRYKMKMSLPRLTFDCSAFFLMTSFI